MKRQLIVATAVLLWACGRDKADTFREGVPQAQDVRVDFPANGSGLSGTAQRQDGLEGDRSMFYLMTRAVTGTINGATVAVLGLVKGITDHAPTTLKDDVAVWGPHTDALSPNTWKLTVTKVGPKDYTYVLEGKGKNEPDSAFKVILSGSHHAVGPHLGKGTFLIDWNEAQKLPEHDDNVGTAEFTYSRMSPSADVTIDVVFKQVRDEETGQRVDAFYQYVATPNQGGAFEFTIVKNLDPASANKPNLETASIKSRWKQSGAGRSDVMAKGGDLGTMQATASECWDENFASRYLNVSFAPELSYGKESACAFASAEYSDLKI